MTGESKIVSFLILYSSERAHVYLKIIGCHDLFQAHKDQKSPFLMAGCKVADGYGTMLVSCCHLSLCFTIQLCWLGSS